ncbi:MAG: TOBE domain-containing protein, partial [Nonomuraea sp.]|nr:TOBE domain-containing protein [Nonomuraea sp.]
HVGDPAALYAEPPTLAVAATLSDPPLNLLPGTLRDGRIEVLGTSFPAPRLRAGGDRVVLGIRPHQVTITPDGPGALELPAEIRLAEVTGSATFLHLLLEGRRHLVAHLPGTQLFVFDESGARLPATSAAEVDLHG